MNAVYPSSSCFASCHQLYADGNNAIIAHMADGSIRSQRRMTERALPSEWPKGPSCRSRRSVSKRAYALRGGTWKSRHGLTLAVDNINFKIDAPPPAWTMAANTRGKTRSCASVPLLSGPVAPTACVAAPTSSRVEE